MAEFCLECWNKINESNDPSWKYILSDESEFCEECQQWKRVIVVARGSYYWCRIRYGLFGFIKDRYQRDYERSVRKRNRK